MRLVLYVMAALALIVAAVLVLTAPPRSVASANQSTEGTVLPSAPVNPLLPSGAPAPPAPTVPVWNATMAAPTAPLDPIQISGRSDEWQVRAPAEDAPAVLNWQALPAAGSVTVLLRSTLGGVSAQRWLSAQWQQQPAGSDATRPASIDFHQVAHRQHGGESSGNSSAAALLNEPLRATLVAGRWQLHDAAGTDLSTTHPALSASVLDAARAIASLRQAFATAGSADAAATINVADSPHRLWPDSATVATAPASWLLIGPSADQPQEAFSGSHYPTAPASGQDWRLELTADGQWQHAIHLSSQAASADQPGIYLRRIHLLWP